MESYTENSELYKLALDDYNNIVDSFEKKKKIADKTKLYFEFKNPFYENVARKIHGN